MSRLLALCIVCTFIGCDLDRPLSDPEATPSDQRLLGNWARLDLQGGVTHEQLFIGKHTTKGNPTGLMDAAFLAYDLKNQQLASGRLGHGCERFYFSTSVIGNSKFVNMYRAGQFGDKPADFSYEESYAKWTRDPERRCCVLMYDVSETELIVTIPDDELFGQLKQKGTLKSGGNKDGVSSASLVAYLEKEGTEKLFPRRNSIKYEKKQIIR